MKKNLFKILLMLLVVLTTAGCIGAVKERDTDVETKAKKKKSKKNKKTQKTEEETEDETEEETEESSESLYKEIAEEIENIGYKYIDIGKEMRGMLPAGDHIQYNVYCQKMELLSNEYPLVSEALEKYNAALMQDAVDRMNRVIGSNLPADAQLNVCVSMLPAVVRADNSVLSLKYEYFFSANVNAEDFHEELENTTDQGMNRTFNFDMASQKEIKLEDIIKDREAYAEALKGIVRELRYDNRGTTLTDQHVDDLLSRSEPFFTIGYDALNLSDPDEYDYYMMWTASVPFKEYPQLFALDYSKVPKAYITYINMYDLGYVDLNHDGKEEMFCATVLYEGGDEGYPEGFRLKTKDREYDFGMEHDFYMDYSEIAIIHLESGKKFLHVIGGWESTIVTFAIDLNTGQELVLKDPDGISDSLDISRVNPSDVAKISHSWIMGTATLLTDGYISEDGEFVPNSEVARFGFYDDEIKVKKDFTATAVDEQLNEVEQEITVKAGEKLIPAYTNDVDYVVLRREDGKLIKIQVIEGEFNGEILDETSDNILYVD